MKNLERSLIRLSTFFILHSAFCIPLFAANILSVERRNLRAGETLLIIVSLEDEFATIDDVRLPLRNLTLVGAPSISSEFSWINGVVVRRKVFRFRARPNQPGPAMVGPVSLATSDGQRDTLNPIAVQVMPDRAATSNDPQVILRELLASGRDPFFVVAEADRTTAYAGEPIVVTWWLYNAMSVEQWQIGSIPRLADFWVEELDVRGVRPTGTLIDGYSMQKVPVRRAALYPLRSGKLDIGPMEVEAAVLRRRSSGPFGLFEGNMIEIAFSSAHVAVESRPLPPGPAVSAVGEFRMSCSAPVQRNSGPVVINATVAGSGNLRAAEAPRFTSAPQGDVQLVQSPVTVQRAAESATMSRRWQFLIFPKDSGPMRVPAMEMRIFSPSAGARRMLRCDAVTLAVTAASPPLTRPAVEPKAVSRRRFWPIAAAALIAIVALALILPRVRERQRVNRQLRDVTASGDPVRIRETLHARMEQRGLDPAALMRERSDRGDAYRSVRSLLDALERERIEVDDVESEIRRRLRDLLAT